MQALLQDGRLTRVHAPTVPQPRRCVRIGQQWCTIAETAEIPTTLAEARKAAIVCDFSRPGSWEVVAEFDEPATGKRWVAVVYGRYGDRVIYLAIPDTVGDARLFAATLGELMDMDGVVLSAWVAGGEVVRTIRRES